MSTPTPRRPLSNTSNASPRRGLNDTSPGRPPSSSNVVPTGMTPGLTRTPSLRQARLPRRSAARMSTSYSNADLDDEDERDTKAELMATLEEQRQHVEGTEREAAQLRKELQMMRSRQDDMANEQTVLEERDLQSKTEVDRLKAKIQESDRQFRELETAHQSQERLWAREKEKWESRDAESQSKIQRLHEMLRDNGMEKSIANRAASIPVSQQPTKDAQTPPASDVPNTSAKMKSKDSTIEQLEMQLIEQELAGAQARQVSDANYQTLQKDFMDLQVKHAGLVEENNYFQMMLEKKMLKGDGLSGFTAEPQEAIAATSLADEMDFEDVPEPQIEAIKKLEADIKYLREQNKALTLYIDKIVGRILQNPGYEHIIVGQDNQDTPPPPPTKPAAVIQSDKALPPAPGQDNASSGPMQSAMSGFLQRTKSVVSRTNAGRPSRPMSYAQPVLPTANENPKTAPSIPLNRGHRRARSDQAQQDLGAAAVVQQMNRGSPLRTVSGGPMSPGISPINPQLSGNVGYFPQLSQASTRAPSGSQQGGGKGSSRNSVNSDLSQERSSTDASSAQTGAPPPSQGPNIPGAVMKQNQLRPLRLVQAQSQDDEEARKRANRGSWMGWFKGSTIEAQNDLPTR